MTTATATAAHATAASAQTRSRRRTVLWVLQILLGLFLLIASAMPKFAGQKDAVETFAKIGVGQWFRYVTGAIEAAGAIGLVVPRLAGLAATGLIGLMIGAAVTQVVWLVPGWAAFPLALGVIFALIAYDRRAETRDLLRGLRGSRGPRGPRGARK
ncbi:DoxX family protein [Actinomadura rupiterrae]|uniref:DoxX family protein n=1 Tax=Actinomadura rupiterrae TaxID=559627 RepID=UPI0020A3827C|nr:DoxX family protein [Actinomadura rupiterrae]MCP2337002.1 putative membrane protein YphA (DoxX/SURF4 family) [Actinomadura rupiterrae]